MLILIIIVTINQLVIETRSYQHLNKKNRDLIEISLLFIYATIGYWGLSNSKPSTYKKIWLTFYTITISLFIIAAIFDWYIFHYSTNEQFRFLALKEILWSPLPYLLFILFVTFSEKKELKKVD